MTYSVIFISGSITEVEQTNSIVECTGDFPTTCSIPDATVNTGNCLYLYNNSTQILTAKSTNGIFRGPFGTGNSFLPIPIGATAYVFSDGTYWIASDLSYNQNNSPYVSAVSPMFSGIPSGPTAPSGSNTDQLATTAFVQEAISLVSGISAVNGIVSAPGLTFPMSSTGVYPGTWNTVVVQADGRITAGSNNTNYLLKSGGLLTGELFGTSGSFANSFQAASGSFVSVSASTGTFNSISSTTASFGNGSFGTLVASGLIVNGPGTLNGIITAPTPVTGTNTNQLATTMFVNNSIDDIVMMNTSITVNASGAATGSGTSANGTLYLPLTLANVGITAGTYNNVYVNSSGLVITGQNIDYMSEITSTDVTNALGFTPQIALGFTPSQPILTTPGTFNNIVINAAGQVVSGTSINYLTSINFTAVTNALGYVPSVPVSTTPGTYTNVVVNNAGQITSGIFENYLTENQSINVSGDVSGTGSTEITLSLATITTPGTYNSVIINEKGLVVSGTFVAETAITANAIETALGYTPTPPILSTSGTYNNVVINSAGQVVSGSFVSGVITYSEVISALGFTPIQQSSFGMPNGVATLDGGGHLSMSQIPASLLGANIYQGTWNASTNTPTLTSSLGSKGIYYIVSNAGTTTLDGISVWYVGDQAIFNGTSWEKIDGLASEVVSVAGRTGAIVLSVSDISGAASLTSPVFTGTPMSSGALSISDNSQAIATTSFVKGQNYLTTNQSISISGDATGLGTNSINLVLSNSGVSSGTYNNIVVNAKGLAVSGTNIPYLTTINSSQIQNALGYIPTTPIVSTSGTYNNTIINNAGQVVSGSFVDYLIENQTITISGDASGSGSTGIVLTLSSSGVSSGTYNKFVVNSKGLITSGLSLNSSDVTIALGYTPPTPVITTPGTYNNLTINSSGQVISGSNVGYLTSNQNITISGDATGTGTTSIALTLTNSGVTPGTYVKYVVNSKGLITSALSLTQNDVTVALGFTPTTPITSSSGTFNNLIVNTSGQVIGGFNTTISSSQITTALGYVPPTPVISTAGTYNNLVINSAGQVISGSNIPAYISAVGSNLTVTSGTLNVNIGVSSFNTRTGAITLTSSDVTTALSFIPTYPIVSYPGTFNTVVLNSVGQITSGSNTAYLTSITSSQVTGALGYIPSTPVISTSGTYNSIVINSAGQVVSGSNTAYLTSNQAITLSGDITGTGTTVITGTLAIINASPGTFSALVVNGKGLVTTGFNMTFTGDATGTAIGSSVVLTLATVATAGTFQSVVINSKGLVISGGALSSSNITTALGYTPSTPIVSTAGTYTQVVVNSAGQVVSGSSPSALLTPTLLTWGTLTTISMSGIGVSYYATATSAMVLSVIGATPGQIFQLDITQDATGSRVVTFPTNMFFQNGITPVLSTAANARDVLVGQVLHDSNILIGAIYSIAT